MWTVLNKYGAYHAADDGGAASGAADGASADTGDSGAGSADVDTRGSVDQGAGEAEAKGAWFDGLEGISDEHKAMIGEKSAAEFFDWSKGQREAAGRRAKDVADHEGLVKPPAKDGEAGEFFEQFAPEAANSYAEKLGKTYEDATQNEQVSMEAAKQAGIHVDQFQKFAEQQEVLRVERAKVGAEEIQNQLKEEWGADFNAKTEFMGRAFKELGWDETQINLLAAMDLDKAQGTSFMNMMATLGERLREGGGVDISAGGGSAGTVEEQIRSIEEQIISQGGNPTPEQSRQLDALIEKASAA